jgi:hypothetical protein
MAALALGQTKLQQLIIADGHELFSSGISSFENPG